MALLNPLPEAAREGAVILQNPTISIHFFGCRGGLGDGCLFDGLEQNAQDVERFVFAFSAAEWLALYAEPSKPGIQERCGKAR
ncbi:MAG TPA: hypothetical protein PKN13_10950 [Accumulibacter sp.]|nr:hypothetical protein [Accumulibacter sp.]HMW18382.1 hypothetical protein [Accumulibacter sp.]HMX23331.1 hypothetical protein [Accumulibacter sp.]HMY07652.1 hypothetical protein [Accumulibacter sp.]HNC18414.1 hypothetical protein [Accumulibacter sp.]